MTPIPYLRVFYVYPGNRTFYLMLTTSDGLGKALCLLAGVSAAEVLARIILLQDTLPALAVQCRFPDLSILQQPLFHPSCQ